MRKNLFEYVIYKSQQKQMLFQVVVDSISIQKANVSVKGTTTNILRAFFLAYNIDVAV